MEDFFDDDRSVVLRLPDGSVEMARVQEVEKYLGELSGLVNSYEATDFKGNLEHTIKTDDKTSIVNALFLDDGKLAVLTVKRVWEIPHKVKSKFMHLDIYSPIDWERILHKEINLNASYFIKNFSMVFTPMRNLLISCFSEKEVIFITRDKTVQKFGINLLHAKTKIVRGKWLF